ncbi:hypothetical protein [Gordonia sihwensis]|uniref:hypothetical protein n=1 Tax=Gordonia sihwensis TaxID=173559 RepID=UPI001C92C528|nr:hypothetical protein [Gordonia sihwensis]
MTTTEDLYQQANETYVEHARRAALASLERAGLRAVVDLVLDARPAMTDVEVLREAAKAVIDWGHDPASIYTVGDVAEYLDNTARRVEAEQRAAQEAAAAEVEREKLIEQAARAMAAKHNPGIEWDAMSEYTKESFITGARALWDAGWRPAPESDGGAE